MREDLKRHDADDRDSSDGTGPYTGRSEEPLDMPSAGPDRRPPLWAPWYGIGFVQAMARFVRKPSGALPGMVLYTDYQTCMAESNEALVERLRVR